MHPLDNAIRERINRKALAASGIIGIVKWYNSARGIGIVKRDDGKNDMIFRASVLKAAGIGTRPAGQHVVVTRWRSEAGDRVVIAEEMRQYK